MQLPDFIRTRPWTRAGLPAAVTAVATLAFLGVCTGYPCMGPGLRYGVWLEQCPTSDLRLAATVSGEDLVRGRWGTARVGAEAQFLLSEGANPDVVSRPFTRGLAVDLALLDSEGQKVEGLESRNPTREFGALVSEIKLPEVSDGDYVLRAIVQAGFETREVRVDVPLFAPAIVHAMSDRGLYKPGQTVLLRSAVLRKTDRTPLESRPGTWRVFDPYGEVMLEEKQATGAWGIAATTFPLDSEAVFGTWKAEYSTGQHTDSIAFEVKPFTLPRFTVDLEPSATWYGLSDGIEVVGTARYTSGAPVAGATVTLTLAHAGGRWPMPLAWEEPHTLTTDADGRFVLDLEEVPTDLIERAQVQVRASVTDEASETAIGQTLLTLSKDALRVSAVTELGDGLVESFNNRAYVRVTHPDGVPLANTEVLFRNAYDPSQPERWATTDVDGVAALQLDPGKPVTIVDEAPPYRPRPLVPAAPGLMLAKVLPSHSSLDLPARRVLDSAHPAIAACGVFAVGETEVPTSLRVDESGTVRTVVTQESAAGQCVKQAMAPLRFAAGHPRTFQLHWRVPDSLQPHLETENKAISGEVGPVSAAVDAAALEARRCIPRGQGIHGLAVLDLHWVVSKGQRRVDVLLDDRDDAGLAGSTRQCVRAAFKGLALSTAASQDTLGTSSLHLSVPQAPGSTRPQATTRTGFALQVSAQLDGEEASTRVVFSQGQIPPIRLRPTPSLATAGDTVTVQLFRGPGFSGDLPKKLELMKGTVRVAKARLDPDSRVATFTLPEDIEGFLHVDWGGARSVVFVKPMQPLSVSLATDADTYRPGDRATLTVQTKAGDVGAPAAVSLAGVDETLGQLAPLLGPDDWGRVTVLASGEDAFDRFGARALQLGQVRGENAALAAVLKVQNLPMDAAGDEAVTRSSSVRPDVDEALTTNFYRGLEALIARVRDWENTEPAEITLSPRVLAGLWTEVLAEAAAADQPLIDAWGRELRLSRLPRELLVQTGPRQVVSDSTRLSEDMTNWPAWVEENRP